jgi:hypothetical protein
MARMIFKIKQLQYVINNCAILELCQNRGIGTQGEEDQAWIKDRSG